LLPWLFVCILLAVFYSTCGFFQPKHAEGKNIWEIAKIERQNFLRFRNSFFIKCKKSVVDNTRRKKSLTWKNHSWENSSESLMRRALNVMWVIFFFSHFHCCGFTYGKKINKTNTQITRALFSATYLQPFLCDNFYTFRLMWRHFFSFGLVMGGIWSEVMQVLFFGNYWPYYGFFFVRLLWELFVDIIESFCVRWCWEIILDFSNIF
jgi:hypothetical protein